MCQSTNKVNFFTFTPKGGILSCLFQPSHRPNYYAHKGEFYNGQWIQIILFGFTSGLCYFSNFTLEERSKGKKHDIRSLIFIMNPEIQTTPLDFKRVLEAHVVAASSQF